MILKSAPGKVKTLQLHCLDSIPPSAFSYDELQAQYDADIMRFISRATVKDFPLITIPKSCGPWVKQQFTPGACLNKPADVSVRGDSSAPYSRDYSQEPAMEFARPDQESPRALHAFRKAA